VNTEQTGSSRPDLLQSAGDCATGDVGRGDPSKRIFPVKFGIPFPQMFPNLQQPRSREERKNLESGGEALEKVRLRQKGIDAPEDVVKPVTNRYDMLLYHENEQQLGDSLLLHTCSSQYMSEHARFQRDAAAALEHAKRLENLNKREVG